MSNGFWDQAEIIHTYTRAQAIEDGVLIDVTAAAREVGFRWPMALTATAWTDAVRWDQDNYELQDDAGRLWDVLTMAHHATKRGTGGDRIEFQVLRIPNTARADRARLTTLQLIVGPGDTADPVLTITSPNED